MAGLLTPMQPVHQGLERVLAMPKNKESMGGYISKLQIILLPSPKWSSVTSQEKIDPSGTHIEAQLPRVLWFKVIQSDSSRRLKHG